MKMTFADMMELIKYCDQLQVLPQGNPIESIEDQANNNTQGAEVFYGIVPG